MLSMASLAHRPVPEQVDRAIALWLEMRNQDVIARIAGRRGARTLVRLVGHALGVRAGTGEPARSLAVQCQPSAGIELGERSWRPRAPAQA